MIKNLSYREQLLELARIYKIHDIKIYIRSKKYLTTAQIEHILKKNKVPVPKEINKSILEIHSKKIIKPFSSFQESVINFFKLITLRTSKTFFNIIKRTKYFFTFLWSLITNLGKWISSTIVNTLNNAYNFKVEEKKANKIVSGAVAFCFLFLLILGGNQIREILNENKLSEVELKVEKKPVVKTPEKKAVVKAPEKKAVVKTPEKKDVVKEFILPDLNLKTETVLSLFSDVDYDLNKVRQKKLVKPIYFTQFPKDLDEIKNVELKKETFIKIVLPLVVAENQKIISDREKLKKIILRKITSDKEKLWLRQKFKEYRIKNGSVDELIKRMDIIPISIAIAQAAKESGWGTSRFALEGNAIFGQWTWNGKGIAPLDRSKEKSHKILRFPILRASVKAYKNNLNTHKSYKEFRETRAKLRSRKKPIKGIVLISTLDNYAQTGVEYTKTLGKMIEQNSLDDFENVKLTNSVIKKELNL